jgi:Ion channel
MSVGRGAVRKRASVILKDSWQSQANLSFFLILQVVISFLLPSLGFAKDDLRIYADLGFSIMLISGVALAWGWPKLFWFAAPIGLLGLFFRWMNWWQGTITSSLLSDWATIFAALAIVVVLLAQVFRAGRVTHVRIQGAIAAYLLLGAAWAHAYHITEILHPRSFALPAGEMLSAIDWIYFSFITLTTVGYGDITPVLPIARTLAVGEALTGQLYLAVMVARLVAMEIVFWQQDTTGNSHS